MMSEENENNKSIEEIQNAIHAARQHLKSNPNDYTEMFKMAQYHTLLGEYRQCSKICHKLAGLGANQYQVYMLGLKADVKSGHFHDAITIAEKGLEKFPDHLNLNLYYSIALTNLERYKEAEKISEKLIDLGGEDQASYVAMSAFYLNSNDLTKALEITQEGLRKFPDNASLLNNLGSINSKQDKYVAASEYFVAALRQNPANTNSIINLGGCMEKMKNGKIAEQFYDHVLESDPKNGVAMCAKASIMAGHGLAQESIPLYEIGLDLVRKGDASNSIYLVQSSNYLFYQHYVPDRPLDVLIDNIKTFNDGFCRDITEKLAIEFSNDPTKDRKLRVGLVSKGFNTHPVGQMIYQAVKHLNKDAFSLYCYTDLAPERQDYLTEKLYKHMDKVIHINNVLNHNVVEMMRGDEIDLLIEMTGHSEGGRRLPLIAERAAPVQVKWVGGLFNTSGMKQMDWLISDNIETPEGADKWYTEKLYRMPDDYIVYNPPYYAPEVKLLPAQANGYVTFGNLNNLAKTNSYSIELWAKVLHAVPGSKVLFKGDKMHEDFAQEHIYAAFEGHGITRDRVYIEGGEDHQKFLNVYNRIDIALDPHPYTGGLTTCEALWMGVPVVTLPGETFAGRHAATHLTNAGMPEWVAKDEQDYIDIAVKWANNIEELAKLRAGMREHVSKTPLVDGPRFAKNLEVALRHMWGEWCDEKEAANKPEKISAPKPKKSKKRKK